MESSSFHKNSYEDEMNPFLLRLSLGKIVKQIRLYTFDRQPE